MTRFMVGDKVRVKDGEANAALRSGEVYTVRKIDGSEFTTQLLYVREEGSSPDGWFADRFTLVRDNSPQVGDLVRITRPSTGRVIAVNEGIVTLDSGASFYVGENTGLTYEVVQRTLPTKTGSRVLSEGSYWILAADGKWWSDKRVQSTERLSKKDWELKQ